MNTPPQKILLSVTGMSPAVVTETLYALVTEKGFIPDEIRVITTQQGKNQVLKTLCGIEGGRKEQKGALEEFISDYGEQFGFQQIHFDESCIEIIRDHNDQKLSDIRSPEENNLAADQIVSLVGQLCQNPQNQLHVSIAGGRKTMGFFMGYALSLYGREHDSLSHVLVSAEFENLPSFYYPKPYSHKIMNSQGVEFDAQNAKVMLAEIPWVRLGLGISDELLGGRISYSDSVLKAQQILAKPSLTFLSPIDDQNVRFGNTEIKLAPKEYSFLLSLVLAKQKHIAYSLFNEDVFAMYLAIYTILKGSAESLENRVKFVKNEAEFAEETKKIYSESCHHLGKRIKKEFSIGHCETPYIPSSSHQCYELLIEEENIDISAILPDLQGKI
ncbi:CRISPR-associated ring nuclease Csm6 [Mannheimia sp. ZY171111]|uniref:CRISPR-associated ring nuclease Csm6 n=1 Tax=Mannheimia sp. ZY171111 TaxID=2679995 RepID=UPI001ADD6473|nr:CRISPR-associated ring nuclease Csm6 [Mannheimia sp. ZY171111]QTM01030.1 TIGR02584 family CRISPR-associated protein [Mannheimia sp. ZY171111]